MFMWFWKDWNFENCLNNQKFRKFQKSKLSAHESGGVFLSSLKNDYSFSMDDYSFFMDDYSFFVDDYSFFNQHFLWVAQKATSKPATPAKAGEPE